MAVSQFTNRIKICLLFLTILLALLHSTSPSRIILLSPTKAKLQWWRLYSIIHEFLRLLIFREDLHFKTTLVSYTLLYLETNFKITSGLKGRVMYGDTSCNWNH
uniref:Uncharacterized protein n=1 Tax=Salix viminalis TaxID=40686 RepID=A0A6N2LWC1_SALVM